MEKRVFWGKVTNGMCGEHREGKHRERESPMVFGLSSRTVRAEGIAVAVVVGDLGRTRVEEGSLAVAEEELEGCTSSSAAVAVAVG